jgi:hypothetical protein
MPTGTFFLIGQFSPGSSFTGYSSFSGRSFNQSDISSGFPHSFTQAELVSGQVYLRNIATANGINYGSQLPITFSVSDNVSNSVSNLTLPVVIEPGGILSNGIFTPIGTIAQTYLAAPIGQMTTLGSGLLTYIAPQSPSSQAIYHLFFAPSHGRVLLDGQLIAVGTDLTQQQIDQGRLSYSEDGALVASDQFGFLLRDPFHPGGSPVYVNVTLTGSFGGQVLTGTSGAETLSPGIGNNHLLGDGGTTVTYANSPNGVTVDLGHGTASNGYGGTDTLSNIHAIIGSVHDDMVTGGPGIDTAVFSGLRSAYTLTRSGHSLVVSGPDGADTLTRVEKIAFTDGTIPSGLQTIPTDFNGDGNSDILWRHDSGQVYFWDMIGLQPNAEGGVAHAPVPNDWHIQGTGDFNGDGSSDILWRHNSGQVYFWEMNGMQIKGEGGAAHAPVPNDWQIHVVGDFNGDGNGDIVWRHDNGQIYFWEMDGLQIKAEGGVAHAPVPNDWHIQGTGDFNGDGNNDIFWRHDSGQVYFWEMDGLQIKAEGGVVHAPVPNAWHILGTGDFNGDGNSDILWRHDSGQIYFWEMEGLQIKAEGTVVHAPVTNDWQVQHIGDFNGDSDSDILWRNDNGQVYIWEMDGLQIKAEGGVAHALVPKDWHIFS